MSRARILCAAFCFAAAALLPRSAAAGWVPQGAKPGEAYGAKFICDTRSAGEGVQPGQFYYYMILEYSADVYLGSSGGRTTSSHYGNTCNDYGSGCSTTAYNMGTVLETKGWFFAPNRRLIHTTDGSGDIIRVDSFRRLSAPTFRWTESDDGMRWNSVSGREVVHCRYGGPFTDQELLALLNGAL